MFLSAFGISPMMNTAVSYEELRMPVVLFFVDKLKLALP